MHFLSLRASLRGLTAFYAIKQEPMMRRALALVDAICEQQGEQAIEAYTGLFYDLHREGFSGLGDWMLDYLQRTPTPYACMMEQGKQNPELERAAETDLQTLGQLAGISGKTYEGELQFLLDKEYASVLSQLPHWSHEVPFSLESLRQYYQERGCGLYAQYRAFLWENGALIPVDDPDCPKPEDLLGYELQRNQVEANTRLMMAGQQANNVLLFGDGGTGKSATVKSMLYLPGMEDLRLIEIQKENITGLPSLIRSLRGRRQKFILFIDDLAFDQDDKTYSSMKTILEGSLEKRPINVAIYATSNRRHLVRQTFADRAGEEVDTFETISEKTALAERFGLRIPYLTMNKASYLALVDHLAQQAGISMPSDVLHAQAMTWEIRHSGRTPRVARQFIASLHIQ